MRSLAFPPEEDTIAAVSTPFGVGGIGIVRMSGPDAEAVARRIFHSKQKKNTFPSHRLNFGHIRDPKDQSLVDEVLMTVMRAPNTYTRQDIVEIQCHGGHVPVRRILELLLEEGVRLAEPGEFTRRAFLNGRIDLVQAEAVVDTVEAKSEAALRFAQRQLDGTLSQEVRGIREGIKVTLMEVEAWLDFPEEEVPEPTFQRYRERLDQQKKILTWLVDTYREGHLYRDGATLVIGGAPNVGKSTLLNVLVGKERAIVSETPGTTRDFLEAPLDLEGIPVTFIDTAGLHETEEEVEAKGMTFARHLMESADLFLRVLDATKLNEETSDPLFETVPEGRTLLVLNKIDLVDDTVLDEAEKILPSLPRVWVSALLQEGIQDLRAALLSRLTREEMDLDSRAVVTNMRHRKALENTLASLERAGKQLDAAQPQGDLLAADLRHALRAVGEILGETTPEEILQGIFDTFCIGK